MLKAHGSTQKTRLNDLRIRSDGGLWGFSVPQVQQGWITWNNRDCDGTHITYTSSKQDKKEGEVGTKDHPWTAR